MFTRVYCSVIVLLKTGQCLEKMPFSRHNSNKFRRPTSPVKISKASSKQEEFLIISPSQLSSYYRRSTALMQKLVLPSYQLAWSFLTRKYGLATFVHERLRYTLLEQFSPTSEIKLLCVHVDVHKIFNVYKPPTT